MVLVKGRVIISQSPGKKPTRFRFKGDIRLGFRKNEVVEVVQFKESKGGGKKMVQGLSILKRQLKGSRKVIRGQAKGIRTIKRRTKKSLKKQAKKTRRSTKRILRGG